MTYPWEDPNLMPRFHVQLETRDIIASYEVATPDYDAVEIAINHLRERLLDQNTHIWKGHTSGIGYHPIGDGSPVIVEWTVSVGKEYLK